MRKHVKTALTLSTNRESRSSASFVNRGAAAALALLCGQLAACGGPEPAASPEERIEILMARTYQEPESGLYIVDGDIPVADRVGLAAFYRAALQAEEEERSGVSGVGQRKSSLIVHRVGGVDARWGDAQSRNLSYCVSTTFGTRYDQVVQALASATAAWESAGRVRFYHRFDQDGACDASNSSVVFDVRPTSGQPYLARAFFPSDARAQRNILIDGTSFTVSPPWTLGGILRHELGHAIGFRHEHTRPESGVCYEDSSWRALTTYDSASVMHYPSCRGSNTGDLVLTARDQEGAATLYGSRPEAACQVTVSSDRAGLLGTTAAQAHDGSLGSAFRSSYNDWQYLQIDFGCSGALSGARRRMTRDGVIETGARTMQGEGVSYSQDGVTWTALQSGTSSGWQGYVSYAAGAWHTVPYGWSAWLRPTAPVQARYLRFRWDGDNDALNEVEADFAASCNRQITSAQPAILGTTAAQAMDGNSSTALQTGFNNWQHLQADLGCVGDLGGLRRLMSRGGATTGSRGAQGEGASYSLDGVTWTSLSGTTSAGWQGYVNYAPTAWHSLPYGLSAWLQPLTPPRARYVRFQWDGDSDALNEVLLDHRVR